MPMIITNEFQTVGPVGIGSQNPVWMQYSLHISCVCFHLRLQQGGEIRPQSTNELCHNSFQEVINRVGAIGKIKTLIYFPIIDNQRETVYEHPCCPLRPYLQILFYWRCHSSSPPFRHWCHISIPCLLLSYNFYSLLRYLARDCTWYSSAIFGRKTPSHQATMSRASECDHFITYGKPFFSSAGPEFLIKASQCQNSRAGAQFKLLSSCLQKPSHFLAGYEVLWKPQMQFCQLTYLPITAD